MTACIVFDIETAPDPRIWDDPTFAEEIRSGLSAPSNYKDPVKIAGYVDDEFDKIKSKAALSWCHGKIRAIGWSMLDSDEDPDAVAGEEEAEVINAFVEQLDYIGDAPAVGGFNIREFDVPFLTFRAAVCGIALPTWWPRRRPYGGAIVDPVDLFGRNGRLIDHLRALDLPPKLGDGADAPDMPIDELIEYVRRDVLCERGLIRRLRQHFPALNGRARPTF